MTLQETMSADLQTIEADMPHTFLHPATGATGPCVPSMSKRNQELLIGGKLSRVVQNLYVRADLFSTAPQSRQPIKFKRNDEADYVEYRIAECRKSGTGAHYELALININEA